MSFIVTFVYIFCNILSAAIFIRVLLSWLPIDARNPLVSILIQITDPVLEPLRRVIPSIGFLDISPIIALLLLQAIPAVLAAALSAT